jgi:NADH-quinone oxidoreductase subunit M
MFQPENILLATLLVPLIGTLLLWVIVSPLGDAMVRRVALGATLLTLLGAMTLVAWYPSDGVPFAIRDGFHNSQFLDVQFFSIGLDGLGIWLFALSAVLMVTAVLVSWTAIKERVPLFFGMLLLLEFGCLGVFTARDIILFYVFFEFTLIPLFFLIGIWGSEDRRFAATKFFLFTLAGSILTFLGLLAIVLFDYGINERSTLVFSIPALAEGLSGHPIPVPWQLCIFVALFAGFAIKVPLFPVHTWLPLAHVQAPTAGSVFLAGILLKIGVYGFLRFSVPFLPVATAICMPFLLWLSVVGIIYGGLVALAQTDMKKLIAYSSVSHLGYCTLGLFALNRLGVQGSAMQMINHGISTGGLFAIVGMLYERYHTREIAAYGGLARKLPVLTFFMVLFTFSSIGLPGTNGFVGEFMILMGMFQRGWTTPGLMIIAVLAVSGVVLGAWYMLNLVRRVFFGPLREPHTDGEVADLNPREIASLLPLAVLVFWIGLYPKFFIDRMATTLDGLTVAAEEEVRHLDIDDEIQAAMPQDDEIQAALPQDDTESLARAR